MSSSEIDYETFFFEPKQVFYLRIIIVLTGCSSSEMSSVDEVPIPDELPIVDAETDTVPSAAPETLDNPEAMSPQGDIVAEQPTTPNMDEAPVPAPVAAPFSGGEYSYEVQSGDTLMKVAYKTYGDIYQWKKVYDDNKDRISNPSQLVAGTQLRVDQPTQEDDFTGFEKYLIKHGDTLGTISDDIYGTKKQWKKLWKMNDRLVRDPNRIYAGFFLKYTLTDSERMEAERLKSGPLAGQSDDTSRNPSSQ